ncbi:hypothetical protein BJ085DRAFT_18329 [Dimargaris cristalligena]|uniref:Peptidase S54 rhomboid domain-containing protein n=1 Tax=Dimargaris cristalligena TaxID=215637 RepID=A0A4P9ZUX6_9FUNG|nr:hypothetical protein BJ085DRAFT_18329 [Dimargaris cristalligena]|eukprot:RKP36622.1 hypothetical protein BJ085DRAFT_18329 [Dimargaris cristalligena]
MFRLQQGRFYRRPASITGKGAYGGSGGGSDSFRRAPDSSRFGTSFEKAKWTIFTIIGMNGAVYLLWGYASNLARMEGNLEMFNMMKHNFTSSLENYRCGYYWSVLTSSFSHKDFLHLGVNMVGLYSFGLPVAQLLGVAPFMGIYLLSCLASSTVSLVANKVRESSGSHPMIAQHSSLGASGGVLGIMAIAAMVYPSAKVMVMFVIPVSCRTAIFGLFGFDVYNMFTNSANIIDSAGHLGGTITGFGFWWIFLRKFLRIS